jgi:hypothetical protein
MPHEHTFHFVPKLFNFVTLILNVDLSLKKKITWSISFNQMCQDFDTWSIEMHFEEIFLLMPNFWPCDVDLEIWPSFERLYPWLYLLTMILKFGLFPGSHFPASYVVYWQLVFGLTNRVFFLKVLAIVWHKVQYQVSMATHTCWKDALYVEFDNLCTSFSHLLYIDIFAC